MKELRIITEVPTESKMRKSVIITVIIDSLLVLTLVACLMVYLNKNRVISYNQNIESMINIATTKSEVMSAKLDNISQELKNTYKYCKDKNVTEILQYLELISDEENEYQLLRRDDSRSKDSYHVFCGYATRGENEDIKEVEYLDSDLARFLYSQSAQNDGEIIYSQGFTNKTDALRYFAVFCGITVKEDGKDVKYYIVKPQQEDKILKMLKIRTQYANLATAVCYPDGKYLVRDSSFRSDNPYDYIYKYNDLSLDERDAIRESVQSNLSGTGVLQYKDLKDRDSVFTYMSCGDEQAWYVVVSVPKSEFVSKELFTLYPLIIIALLVVLLTFNTWRLLLIVRELRLSVKREQVASNSKSSFLSRMSHEIRTPLNAVIGYNAIAKNSMENAKTEIEYKQAEMKVLDCLVKSEIASKHLLTVINDVLDMSAIESGKIQVEHNRFDFKGLITSLTTIFYSQAKAKDVEFEVVFDDLTEEWFVGDQMRTNQILANLLSNAIKFTSEGGKVVMKIQQPEADVNASHIHFEITDTGIGMAEEYLTHIWTPFQQADSSISRRFGGSGLGLSITKNLVDLMGGSITVESIVGVGTTFKVDLTFGRTTQPNEIGMYNFDSINALVVDDDISTCDYIRLLFNRCGAQCTAVTSGEDALKAISIMQEEGDKFGVCLVDWKMPNMDGIETIKRIREMLGEKLPIIILTAYDFAELAEKAAEVGVRRFISKPLFQSSLFDLLADINGISPARYIPRKDTVDFAGARVLLAEDNAMNMEIARMVMESSGLIVESVWNGREAVEKFVDSEPGTFVAILMDVHMPEMNGHDATIAIRASQHSEAKTIPIIAMTADAFAENVAEAIAVGMNDHISKPLDITVLFDTLKKYIITKPD